MYHSITFGNKNTWDDWHLVPTPNSPRPVVVTPTQKTNYIDIPGANGALDLSESLTGYPLFNNREGSFEFYVMNGYQDWVTLYNELCEHLHGRRMKMTLEDDPAYYYIGRFSVEWKSTTPRSTVTIKYTLDPYKWMKDGTGSNWLWNTFNFTNGIIRSSLFEGIAIDSPSTFTDIVLEAQLLGPAPTSPKLTIADAEGDGLFVKFSNPSLGIDISYPNAVGNGTYELSDCILNGTDATFSFKGKGTISIIFDVGRI